MAHKQERRPRYRNEPVAGTDDHARHAIPPPLTALITGAPNDRFARDPQVAAAPHRGHAGPQVDLTANRCFSAGPTTWVRSGSANQR